MGIWILYVLYAFNNTNGNKTFLIIRINFDFGMHIIMLPKLKKNKRKHEYELHLGLDASLIQEFFYQNNHIIFLYLNFLLTRFV